MLSLIAISIALLTAFFLDKPLKKRPEFFYTAAALVTAAVTIIMQLDAKGFIDIDNEVVKNYILGLFYRGALGGAFWIVVMWAGALPNGSAPIKKLMPIRGELSIFAAILSLSHVITFGIQYISDIINEKTGSGDALRDFVLVSILGTVMVLIMVPLTVMSFKKIRKKMNPKMWKKIQRTAYVFYAFLYLHILVLYIPKAQKGREGFYLSIIYYSIVFVGYAVFRLRKVYVAKKKPESRLVTNIVCACAIIVPVVLCGFVSRNTNENNEVITATKDKPATFTFEAPTTAPGDSGITAVTTTTSAGSDGKTTTTTDKSGTTTTTSTTTGTGTTTTAVTTADTEEETEAPEENTPEETPDTPEESANEPAPEEPEPVVTPEPEQPVYRFKNGTFEGSGEGYAGTVHVKITIENDYITGFSAYADDDDPDYFSDAMMFVIPQIQSSASADGIDTCSGATYSSMGIIAASRDALSKALN